MRPLFEALRAPFVLALVGLLPVVGCGDDDGSSSGNSDDGGEPVPPVPVPVPTPPLQAPPGSCEGLDPDQPVVLYVSSDDSNSMASPIEARERISNGMGTPFKVRTYEFFNYYRVQYPAPAFGQLALFAEAEADTEPGSYALQFAVRSYDAPAERRPMTITFVVDTSGSMEGDPIERARAAIIALSTRLRPGDVVNMLTWSVDQQIILDGHEASGADDDVVVDAADDLQADGGTDLHSGLVRGYQLAMKTYEPERLNRLVLISDGGANVGVTDADVIAQHAELNDGEGIYLVGIGTGPIEAYNDGLMDIVTDAGRGAYIYLDEPEEAERILADRFDEVMDVAARGVQVELTLPWYFQMQRFYGEQVSENPLAVKPQHLAPSDAMVFLQSLKACDPSIVSPQDHVQIRATWETPLSHEKREVGFDRTLGELLAGSKTNLAKGRAIAAYADAVRSGSSQDLQLARDRIELANPEESDAELSEIAELLSGL